MIECPKCGAPMVSKVQRATGQRFWGCSKFPACKGTRNTDGEPPRQARPAEEPNYDRGLPSERRRANDRRRWE